MSIKGKPHYEVYIKAPSLTYYNGNYQGRSIVKKVNGDNATQFGTNDGEIIVMNMLNKITIHKDKVIIEDLPYDRPKLNNKQ